MRAQEAKFAKKVKETSDMYKRLRKTALSLPTSVVQRAVASMQRRVAVVVECKGGLFQE